jgi:hypothetical protein
MQHMKMLSGEEITNIDYDNIIPRYTYFDLRVLRVFNFPTANTSKYLQKFILFLFYQDISLTIKDLHLRIKVILEYENN